MKAFKKGWETHIIEVDVKHNRPASHDYNPIKMNFKYGFANYKNGGNLFLAFIRTIVRIPKKPWLLASISYLLGYLYATLSREAKNVDNDLARFINKFHLSRLKNMNRY
jgi:hypothetical protein